MARSACNIVTSSGQALFLPDLVFRSKCNLVQEPMMGRRLRVRKGCVAAWSKGRVLFLRLFIMISERQGRKESVCVYRRSLSPGGKKRKEQDLFLISLSFRMIYTKVQRQRQSTSQREAGCCFYFCPVPFDGNFLHSFFDISSLGILCLAVVVVRCDSLVICIFLVDGLVVYVLYSFSFVIGSEFVSRGR